MKKNQLKEIKALEIGALKQNVKEARQELADLIMDKNMKKLKDVKSVFKKRKDIAKLLTIMRQKQLMDELGREKV